MTEPTIDTNRRTLRATCGLHSAASELCELTLIREDGDIVIYPHSAGSCTLILDTDQAMALRDVLIGWLG